MEFGPTFQIIMVLYDWYTIGELYTPEECDIILNVCKENKSRILQDSPAPNKSVDTKLIDLEKFNGILERYFNVTKDINNTYFGYSLHSDMPLGINFNCYKDELNEYPYHRDSTDPGTASDSKLTAILNISNEPYQGGEFQVFLGKDIDIPLISKQGTLLVFPSFWFHRVTPVTSGVRYTISTWFKGPNWK